MKGVKAELMAYSKEPFNGYLVMLSVFCIFFIFPPLGDWYKIIFRNGMVKWNPIIKVQKADLTLCLILLLLVGLTDILIQV